VNESISVWRFLELAFGHVHSWSRFLANCKIVQSFACQTADQFSRKPVCLYLAAWFLVTLRPQAYLRSQMCDTE
jgi:hypothetical protein